MAVYHIDSYVSRKILMGTGETLLCADDTATWAYSKEGLEDIVNQR